MNTAEATLYLEQFIGQKLRLHTTDDRIFGGSMKCTDKDRNIILSNTYEYRAPSARQIQQTIAASGNTTANVPWSSRFVGLVVVPGQHVTKIEYEDSPWSGARVVL